MNFLKVFFAFLFLGAFLFLKTDVADASQWGPNCSSAPADHRICPSGFTPDYATGCIDSVNIAGSVVQYGLTPEIGNVRVTVKAAAAQLACSSVQCLRREDTQIITLTPNNGESNPALYNIDTLGCSGGTCDDGLTISIASIDKGGYSSCTSLVGTANGQLSENGQTIRPTGLSISCAPPTPTRTPAGKRSPCPPHGDVDGSGSINQRDVDEYNKYIAGITPRNFYESAEFADTNGDGRFDWKDRDNIAQFIAGSISDFPVCQQPSPTSIPNACNVDCTRDSDCQADIYSSSNTCTACVNNKCQVPPACNSSCVRDSDCNAGPALRDGCVDCINNTCQVPLTPTSVPSAAPSSTPVPTNPPPPTSTPRPTATPTPAFNPDSCKCDGIEYTTLYSGQPTTITSYGKVEGADVSRSQIVDQKFYLYEGAESTANRIMQSGAIPATIHSQTASKVRYKSIWQLTLPQLKSGATYRIQSVINCQPKATAFNAQATQTTSVLANTTKNLSLLDRILIFFNGLFGGEKSIAPAITPTVAPSATPFTSADTSVNDISVNDVPTPTIRKQLQLEPIYPLEVYQKTCSFIKFRTGLN